MHGACKRILSLAHAYTYIEGKEREEEGGQLQVLPNRIATVARLHRDWALLGGQSDYSCNTIGQHLQHDWAILAM